jgi:nucleoside-diphosphate-sugar epimerase
MKNVLMLGASGNIAWHVIDLLAPASDLNLTLFLRSARRLPHPPANARVVEGDVLNFAQLKAAVAGQDIVYATTWGAWPNTSCGP